MSVQLAIALIDTVLVLTAIGTGFVVAICYKHRHSAFGIR